MIMCLNTALQVNIPPHLGGPEIRKNMEVEHDNGMEKWPVSQRISHMQDLTYMSRNTKHLSYQCAVRDNISLHLLLISGRKEGSLIKLSWKSILSVRDAIFVGRQACRGCEIHRNATHPNPWAHDLKKITDSNRQILVWTAVKLEFYEFLIIFVFLTRWKLNLKK
jgi:hypothetical protein